MITRYNNGHIHNMARWKTQTKLLIKIAKDWLRFLREKEKEADPQK